ncbi:DUF2167 domain-containing protein [Flavobacterium sp.]|uniref:DUF2167 domain-containing protein n=1 Tax=Flavobacterium sp. TaxID=239 RepID=UPI002B4B6D65|nr:DUF2167 domain-containing protein [Flavobacterium sp.]HLP63177.1 DUF2167 domain-containing protein [Flavobacterium sp.]
MKKKLLSLFLIITSYLVVNAQEDTLEVYYQKIEQSLKYQTGTIELTEGNGTLSVPKGFKFLDGKQTQYVLHDLWGNPEDTTVLGSLVPENIGVTYANSWLFVISYQADGYVKDDDANDIDYDELLEQMKEDTKVSNEERKKMGYDTAELIGWASKPFYDDKLKVLHWAKEIKFGSSVGNTLNYDLRVLGRRGMYNVSAVANMSEIKDVKSSIPGIINSIQFKEGDKYIDFDSSTDTVAAWTIGGLVAGKVLAKVGFFAIIAKFGKIIFFGLIAAFAAVKKFIFNKKDQEVSRPKEDIAEEQNNENQEP